MPRPNRGPHLWQHPKTGIWYVRQYIAGKRAIRTTDSGNRVDAEAALARALHAAQQPQLPPEPRLADVLTAYAAARTETHSHRQLASKCKIVAARIGHLRPAEVTAAHVRSYIALRRKDGRADGTIAEELRKARAALRWAHSEGLIAMAPPIRIPISGQARDRWLSQEEADRLIAACVEPHVRTYLTLALHTAARSSAILELLWAGVDLDAGIIAFPVKIGGKRRVAVPVNDTLDAELRTAHARGTTRWVVEYAGQRVTGMRSGWRAVLRRSGIEHCTRHDLRRTAGSFMLQRGVRIEDVSAMLGHSNIAITRRVYAHLNVEHLRAAVRTLDKPRDDKAREEEILRLAAEILKRRKVLERQAPPAVDDDPLKSE